MIGRYFILGTERSWDYYRQSYSAQGEELNKEYNIELARLSQLL